MARNIHNFNENIDDEEDEIETPIEELFNIY